MRVDSEVRHHRCPNCCLGGSVSNSEGSSRLDALMNSGPGVSGREPAQSSTRCSRCVNGESGQARLRSRESFVLPRQRDACSIVAPGAAEVARAHLRVSSSQRSPRTGLLPDPAVSGRGAGDARRDVAAPKLELRREKLRVRSADHWLQRCQPWPAVQGAAP